MSIAVVGMPFPRCAHPMPPSGPKSARTYLRKLRERRGLSTRGLARHTRFSQGFITLVENGYRNPGETFLRTLAAFYDVDPIRLLRAFGLIRSAETHAVNAHE